MKKLVTGVCFVLLSSQGVIQASPVWTFTPSPIFPPTVSILSNIGAVIQYEVTNQSTKMHTLTMSPIPGIQQIVGDEFCSYPFFVLAPKASCALTLLADGNQLQNYPRLTTGPVVCQGTGKGECYQPTNPLDIRIIPVVTVSGSPLKLFTNGPSGTMTVTNESNMNATNIHADFNGTALNGKVTSTACSKTPPGKTCTLTFTPSGTAAPQTSFPIYVNDFASANGKIAIDLTDPLSTLQVDPSYSNPITFTIGTTPYQQTFTVTNTGNASVDHITAVGSWSDMTGITIDDSNCSSLTLQPQNTCQINITFAQATTPGYITVSSYQANTVNSAPIAFYSKFANGYIFATIADTPLPGQTTVKIITNPSLGGLWLSQSSIFVTNDYDGAYFTPAGTFAPTGGTVDPSGNTYRIITKFNDEAVATYQCYSLQPDIVKPGTWYLPSIQELGALYPNSVLALLDLGFMPEAVNQTYWSSSTANKAGQLFEAQTIRYESLNPGVTAFVNYVSQSVSNSVLCARYGLL